MKASRKSEIRVGIFVLVALVIGGSMAFVLGNQRNAFASKVEYLAVFSEVGGLQSGSPVRIAGVNVGTVSKVRLREDGKIEVRLEIVESASPLAREDSVATIGNKGLLGDRLVDITPGKGKPLPERGEFVTQEPADISKTVQMATSILSYAESTAENLRIATQPLADPAFGEDIKAVAHNLARLSDDAAENDGLVRRLLTDKSLADSVESTLDHAEVTAREISATAATVRRLAHELEHGESFAHAVLYGESGDELLEGFAGTADELSRMLKSVRQGDGALHELVYGQEGGDLLENLRVTSSHLRAIVEDVRAGRGTLGALLTDPSVYEDVKRLVGDLERNKVLRALVRYSIRKEEERVTE